jgi:hypothetical protein
MFTAYKLGLLAISYLSIILILTCLNMTYRPKTFHCELVLDLGPGLVCQPEGDGRSDANGRHVVILARELCGSWTAWP